MIGVADRLSRIVAEKIELPMRDPARQLKLFVIQFKTATDRLRGLLARIGKNELLGGQIRSNLPGLTRIDRDVDFLGSQISYGHDITVGKLVEYVKTAIAGLSHDFEAYARLVLGDIRDAEKLCSVCGFKKEDLVLSDRQWCCESCGMVHDRDINAAINILNEAARGYREAQNACGEDVRPKRHLVLRQSSLKQEGGISC